MKTTEKQFEDIHKQLYYTEINMAIEKQPKNFEKLGMLPNYLKRQLRPRSKLRTRMGWRRLKPDLQRNSPL